MNEKEKKKLVDLIAANSSSIVKIDDMYEIVSKAMRIKSIDLKTVEYETFFKAVKEIELEGVIKSYGSKMNAMGLYSLHLKYRVIKEKEELVLSGGDKMFLYSLNSSIDTSFYFRNTKELESDRADLIALSTFLDGVDKNTQYISINERSYELFGYEKRLSGAGIKPGLLQRTKVDLEKICCFETYTPLQCHILQSFYNKDVRNILIVENLDTYWSFHRAMNETSIGENIDMLVYGCGNKASGNFKFHRHYAITENDNIYYFGDIDPEGFSIYNRVKTLNSSLNIKLANDLYAMMVELGEAKGLYDINNKNQVKLNDCKLDEVLDTLEPAVAMKVKEILLKGKYIPQEAINYRVLVQNTQVRR